MSGERKSALLACSNFRDGSSLKLFLKEPEMKKIIAITFATLSLVGCKSTSEMSYGELREFVRVTADRCDKEFGTKTPEERETCVLHEAKRHNQGIATRKDIGSALAAASAARRPVTCQSSGGFTNCY